MPVLETGRRPARRPTSQRANPVQGPPRPPGYQPGALCDGGESSESNRSSI